jgi:ParB family chromosome partitioning protein
MTELPAPILQRVRLADVQIAQRLRPVSEAGVEAILASVEEIGRIKDPIHLRKSKKGLTLLAGGHRHEAYRRLSIDEIDAWVWSGITDDHARLIEIDDNLAGAEMGPLDTAVFLAERKRVYERLHPETKRGVAGALARHSATDTMSVASFVAATAEKFGLSPRHVFRMVAAGEKLGADSARLRHCPRPVTLKDLIEIAKVGEPTERYAIVDALRDGTAKSAAEARRTWLAKEKGEDVSAKDPVEEAFNALSKAWSRAPMAAKKRFLFEFAKEIWHDGNAGVPLHKWREASE